MSNFVGVLLVLLWVAVGFVSWSFIAGEFEHNSYDNKLGVIDWLGLPVMMVVGPVAALAAVIFIGPNFFNWKWYWSIKAKQRREKKEYQCRAMLRKLES